MKIKKYGKWVILFLAILFGVDSKICAQIVLKNNKETKEIISTNNKLSKKLTRVKYSVGFEGKLGSKFEVIILVNGLKPKKKIRVEGFLICMKTINNQRIYLSDSTMIGCYINDGAILNNEEFNQFEWKYLIEGNYKAEIWNVHLPMKNNSGNDDYELPKIIFDFVK